MSRDLRIQVRWGNDVVHESILPPSRPFVLGEDSDASFVFPECLLGKRKLSLIEVVGNRVFVARLSDSDTEPSRHELLPGTSVTQTVGAFTIEVSEGPHVASPVRRFYAKPSVLGYFVGSLAVLASVLTALAYSKPALEATDEREEQQEQVFLIRHYLAAGAEREREPDESQSGASGNPRGLEGSAGRSRHGRAGVSGTRDAKRARLMRTREARNFGMTGLVPEPDNDEPSLSIRPGTSSGDDSEEQPSDAASELPGGEEYSDFGINPAVDPKTDRFSTFAVDVDTGSYFVAKRKILEGSLPPLQAVRPEEFVNAFDYDYPGPESESGNAAFAVELDGAASPLEKGHHLLRVAVQGRRIPRAERKPVHLVYLVDTSGSMQSEDKIELVQASLRILTSSLKPGDTVALATYAGETREVLAPTGVEQKARILRAIAELETGGGTAMASGIDTAYRLAERTVRAGSESRVIVLSDGDANVGPMSADEILALVGKQRARGITLSTVGFGQGNYKDSTMERLADAGDGNYSYVGSERDARRVFSDQVEGLLQVIARDVKIQVEIDPTAVASYRLIGYENRDVADQDFRKDDVDGGEIGAGHNVTAIYDAVLTRRDRSPLTLRIRHKPASGTGPVVEQAFVMPAASITDDFAAAEPNLRFATAVAAFAEVMRGSPRAFGWRLDDIEAIARESSLARPERIELVDLVQRAARLRNAPAGCVVSNRQGWISSCRQSP